MVNAGMDEQNEIKMLRAVKARLGSPHLMRFYEYFEQDGVQYIVTEYIRGLTLREWLIKQEKVLSEGQARSVIRQVFKAVEILHGAGIVHRDIKMDNILVA